jgi:hypothetical protein
MPIELGFITLYYVAGYLFKSDGVFLFGYALPPFFVFMYYISFASKGI